MKLKLSTPSLEDRIRETQDAAEAWLDAKSAALAKEHVGVPQFTIRNLLTARSAGCPCNAVLRALEQE
jgi:hypothetical protein